MKVLQVGNDLRTEAVAACVKRLPSEESFTVIGDLV